MVDQSSVEVPRPEEKPDSPTCSSSRAASARGYQSRPAPRPAFFRCGRSPQGEAGQSGTIVLRVEPVQLVVLGEDGAVRLAARAVVLLLGVEAVELVLLLRTAVEGAEVDVRRPVLGGRGDAQLAEENDAVGRLGNANLLEVVRREADQLIVAEVRLSGPSVKTRRGGGAGEDDVPRPGSTRARALGSGQLLRRGTRRRGFGRLTVVVAAQLDELLLDLVLDVVEDIDRLLLGRMGRAEVDGLLGSLGRQLAKPATWPCARARSSPLHCLVGCLFSGERDR